MHNFSKVRLAHYLVLFIILALGGLLFWRWQYFPNYQFLIVVLTVAGYILWGVSYHLTVRRLSWTVILEYILLGFVVILMFAAALGLWL